MAVKKTTKLAKAQYSLVDDRQQLGIISSDSVDYMELPTKYSDMIKACRFFYKHDPIAGTVLNKMVDCSITTLDNQKGSCTDEEFAVYEFMHDMLEEFFRNVCLEYLLSGLVVPHYEWERVSGASLSPDLNSRRRVWVPNNIWFRDPATIVVKKLPTDKRLFYVKIDSATIQFIKSGGKLSDGTYDKETYQAMVRSYPDFVAKIRALKGTSTEILLDTRAILSRCLPEDPYPVPYMTNALEPLMHKRNLRKMDYAVAARVIAAIQLIKLGSDDFPVTDEDDFTHIKEQMNYRTTRYSQDKVFQLFANHTLEISWVFPDTEAMLNREKYSSVEDDIVAGFGFPRTLITGETLRSNVQGGSDLASFSPIATMEGIRTKLLAWTRDLYKEVKERNGFKNVPIPRFEPIRLYSIRDLNEIGQALYEEGSLSRRSRLQSQGYDLDTEMERIKEEDQEYQDRDIREAPYMPFSSPTGGFNRDGTQTETKPTTTKKTPKKKETTKKE